MATSGYRSYCRFCIAKGIAIHGHPLVWGLRKAHFPNWILKKYLTGKEREEFNKLVTAYVESDDYYFGEEKYNDNYQKYLQMNYKPNYRGSPEN